MIRHAAGLLGLCLALAGCGNDRGEAFALTFPDGGLGGPGAGKTITIMNYEFAPFELFASPGDTVTVINYDGDSHTVVSEAAPGLDTYDTVNGLFFFVPPFKGIASFQIPATVPAGTTVYYFCTIHPNGHPPARITVQ